MTNSDLKNRWQKAWPQALAAWSRYTQLSPPLLCENQSEARHQKLTGSFAMIRLNDQTVVIDLPQIIDHAMEDYAVEILAHEIGHHILAPASLTDHARCLALMRRALPTIETKAPMVANLYTDLLINDRLQRSANLRMDEIYRILSTREKKSSTSVVWTLYMRIYELLWSLPKGSLGGGNTSDALEGDAWLGMRLIRSYAFEWLGAAGKFAALLLPHLLEDKQAEDDFAILHDTRGAGDGGVPSGLTDASADEGDINHPSLDPRITGETQSSTSTSDLPQELPVTAKPTGIGQQRQPFEYAEILKAAGWPGTAHDAAIEYYRELASRHLVRYPRLPTPESIEPQPEGLEPWDMGNPLDECDWFQSILQSPHIIPGLTTVRRIYGNTPGHQPRREPLDLDLYVDSSGSMPDPAIHISYPALAGAIIVLSALRSGASVQATLWSGKHQFQSTPGFIRDETAILRVLTAHYGGGTQFPLHALRKSYALRRPDERPVHILSISDDGVTTMFEDYDERAQLGWDICSHALRMARGGGTLALNISSTWEKPAHSYQEKVATVLRRARDDQSWQIHAVPSMEGLLDFAHHFSRQKFGNASEPSSKPTIA